VSGSELIARLIDPDRPCFIIAEAGVNHNGRLETGLALVEAAARAGADAVKFQTFKAERLAGPLAPKAPYQARTTGGAESQQEMLQRLELGRSEHEALLAKCGEEGIEFMSTPFDEPSADLLEGLGVALYKLPSGELTNLAFLAHVARKGKPMILSTGMADLSEVEAAVESVRAAGNPPLVLLHCLSAYPAKPEEVNLRAMETMARAFGLPVGFSDHSLGLEIALAARALGARVIEKHFTLDRTMEGPDHAASLEPAELAALVRGIRKVEAALGHGRKEPAPSEAETAAVVRKSLVAARDIPAGTALTPEMVALKRPGTGLPPGMGPRIVGRTALRLIREGELISLEMLK